MFTLPIISLLLLFIYVADALSSNALPPRNPIVKRILLSILTGFAVQLAVITMIPGVLVVSVLFPSDALKTGNADNWRVLIANMFLYAAFSFLILSAMETNRRVKKSVN